MREKIYDRAAALEYARRWALDRNDKYYNFDKIGGDCTSFVSQCLYAGAKVMNYTPNTGWYYRSAYDRTASWSGVEYLFEFLVNNSSAGPYAHTVSEHEVEPGDIVQLGRKEKRFYHTLVITATAPAITVAAHSYDALDILLSSYRYEYARFLHIDGVRKW
ncbi:MAG: amidase domain-containing protein [Clostridia bacterium]|nr:amidase domain-containing protein [Clostridia bacterium]